MKLKGKYILAYTAGIFDGEGCISIVRRKGKKGFYCQLYISVGSTDEWLAEWLKMQYGGSVIFCEREGNKQNLWKWNLWSRKATTFLALILPYLNLKRPQAELAIGFQLKNNKLGKTDAELAIIEAERLMMGKMNKRGRGKETV